MNLAKSWKKKLNNTKEPMVQNRCRLFPPIVRLKKASAPASQKEKWRKKYGKNPQKKCHLLRSDPIEKTIEPPATKGKGTGTNLAYLLAEKRGQGHTKPLQVCCG
jgi:hypothetical protein